jgi:hypothetical protein
MSAYARNHLSSRFYLGGFADADGSVEVVTMGGRRPVRLAKPDNIAYRRNFWGKDAALRREVERKLSEVESDAAPVLRDLVPSWPLPASLPERAPLLQFLALHLLRTPGWRQLLLELGVRCVAEYGHLYPGEMSRDEMLEVATSDSFVADALMSEIPVLASMFGSMHWSLVRFHDPCLVTSDQPVVAVPFQPGGAEEVLPFPSAGLLHTLEYRIAIDPRHLLLLTWLDNDDSMPPIAGTPRVAAEANASVRAQASTQWFCRPESDPPLGTVLLRNSLARGIAPVVLPSYSLARARRSRRRREANRHMREMTEENATDELRVTIVQRRNSQQHHSKDALA